MAAMAACRRQERHKSCQDSVEARTGRCVGLFSLHGYTCFSIKLSRPRQAEKISKRACRSGQPPMRAQIHELYLSEVRCCQWSTLRTPLSISSSSPDLPISASQSWALWSAASHSTAVEFGKRSLTASPGSKHPCVFPFKTEANSGIRHSTGVLFKAWGRP